MPLILPGNVATATAAVGYTVANSCRFQDSDSAEMSRAIASTGSNTTWTVSAWVKRVELGQSSPIFGTGDGGANNDARMVFFDADDKIECSYYNSGYTYEVTTNRVFRDISAWYNICILFDTTESTEADRVKIYVNGTQETSFATSSYPAEDASFNFGNTSYTHYVNDMGGRNIRGSHYIAELVYIDGTASAVTNFGEFSEDSPTIWMPKDVSGLSVGTNGVYLDFEDSANLGNAVDGGTDFTESGLDATDQATDTPTNNFPTNNPLYGQMESAYHPASEEGNLQNTSGTTQWKNSISTIGVTAGKWFMEAKIISVTPGEGDAGDYELVGVTDAFHPNNWGGTSFNNYTGFGALQIGYYHTGTYYKDGSGSSYGDSFTAGDIIGVALNVDDLEIKFYKNGTVQNSGTAIALPTSASSTGLWLFMQSSYNSVISMNYGSPAIAITSGNADADGYGNFEYAVPSGFYALCTKNLAEYG